MSQINKSPKSIEKRKRMCLSTFERKSIPIVAWYMLSNESYMNRVIKDVLPTVKDHVSNFDNVGSDVLLIVAYRSALLETQVFIQSQHPNNVQRAKL